MKKKIVLSIAIVFISIISFVIYNFSCSKQYIIGDEDISKPDKSKRYHIMNASIVGYSQDDLMAKSDIIVQGKVDKIHDSKWTNPDGKKINPLNPKSKARNLITTDVDIEIQKLFKGTPYNDKKISVRNRNGKIGNDIMYGDHIPDLKLGENVLLFLKKDDSDIQTNENYYVLTVYYQGKYICDGELNSNSVYKSKESSIKLPELESKIKNAIDYAKQHPKKEMTPEELREYNKKMFGDD